MKTLLIALTWLCCSGPAHAAPDAPTPLTRPEPALTDAQRAEAMAPYIAALSAGDKTGAAEALLRVTADANLSPVHGEAWLALGALLEDAGLRAAAVTAYGRGFDADPARGAALVDKALALTETLGLDDPLAGHLKGMIAQPLDPELRSKVSLSLARHLLRNQDLGQAAGLLYTVDPKSSLYADSRNLLGVVLTAQGKPDQAAGAFAEAQAIGAATKRGERFADLASLNLGRAYFTAGNWAQAVYHYQRVSRGSELWPEAQFEQAWAYFRAEDMNGALGALMTTGSPFFDDWYFAEADLLRAYSYFLMCKFPEATKAIDAFASRYKPLSAELDQASAGLTPAEAFQAVKAARSGESTKLPLSLLREFTWEDRFGKAIDAIAAAEADLAKASVFGTGNAAEAARELTQAWSQDLVNLHGQRVIDRVRKARTELDEMLQGIEITRLDMLALEAQMYERAAATGTLEYGDAVGRLRDMRKKQKRKWVWPYQGEYWADELGYYQLNARPDCPENMARGE